MQALGIRWDVLAITYYIILINMISYIEYMIHILHKVYDIMSEDQ